MKFFNKMQVPVVERAELASRAGYAINKMIWDIVAAIVRQINEMMESLLKNINPNFPLWGKCEEIIIRQEQGGGDVVEVAVRHNLGVIPTRWIPLGLKTTNANRSTTYSYQVTQSSTAWTTTTVFFLLPTLSVPIEYKILLLP